MKYDPEIYLDTIQTFLQSNLNNEIIAMNSEKNDSITLKQVSNSAYFVQTFNDAIANYDPHVLIGVNDIQSSGMAGTVKVITFDVILIVEDRGEDLHIGKRMLRYLRVLEDLFNRSFNKIIPHATFRINSLVPISLTSSNTNQAYRAVGVQVVTSLG